jgi:hypothetical protein
LSTSAGAGRPPPTRRAPSTGSRGQGCSMPASARSTRQGRVTTRDRSDRRELPLQPAAQPARGPGAAPTWGRRSRRGERGSTRSGVRGAARAAFRNGQAGRGGWCGVPSVRHRLGSRGQHPTGPPPRRRRSSRHSTASTTRWRWAPLDSEHRHRPPRRERGDQQEEASVDGGSTWWGRTAGARRRRRGLDDGPPPGRTRSATR